MSSEKVHRMRTQKLALFLAVVGVSMGLSSQAWSALVSDLGTPGVQSTTIVSDLAVVNLATPTATADFLDAFHFTVSNNGLGENVQATINLAPLANISGLQARLYSTIKSGTNWTLATSDTSLPAGTSMIQAWTATEAYSATVAAGAGGYADILNSSHHLNDGEYILEFRGKKGGGSGNESYEGHLDVSTVPLPTTAWLFAGGLGLLGLGRSNRKIA
jgi:hypothetical protein